MTDSPAPRDRIAAIIWHTSQADEGTISATGANIIADALLAAFPVLAVEPTTDENEAAWRKAIADQVRRNCTLDWDIMQKGGDALIYAVGDWIEHPPEWSHFVAPLAALAPEPAEHFKPEGSDLAHVYTSGGAGMSGLRAVYDAGVRWSAVSPDEPKEVN